MAFCAPAAILLQTGALGDSGASYLAAVIGISVLSLLVAAFFSRYVLGQDTGTAQMQKISNAIKEGAEAFLRRQNKTIIILALVLAVIIYLGYAFGKGDATLALRMTISFVIGSLCSLAAGFSGMWVSIRSNIRVASAARSDLNRALQIALRGGAVTGLSVVALSLLGVGSLFWIFGGLDNPEQVPHQIIAFGFGASFVALFAQLGGGIYTKAADVGADLVGKVEANIPEDDPRNPAVIADLVGDNVGDCAGRGADLFESTAAENIGTMILGATLYQATHDIGWMLFPLVLGAFGIIASSIGMLYIRPSVVIEPKDANGRDPSEIAMNQLNVGFYITCALSVIGVFAGCYLLLSGNNVSANYGIPAWVWYGLAGCVGILLSIAFVFITQYYTAGTWRPVREIAESSLTGPATTIIQGITIGFECVVMPVLSICAALGLSYFFGSQVNIPLELQRSGVINVSGIFGTAAATVGMLMSCAYILAMDTFGPITDNAGGITEMGGQAESVRDITDALDGVGNTTKALTKGYGIGSAALAAFLLFSAYLDVLYSYT